MDDYKIIYPFITCITIAFSLYILIVNLFIFRILNMGTTIDLKLFYVYIQNILKTYPYHILISTSILILGLLLLGFLFLHFIKAFINKQFIMVHIYLSKFNLDWCLRHDYHLTFLIRKYFDPYFKSDTKPNNYYEMIYKLEFIERHLGLILILISILYDCVFNNFILTKLYYVFPLSFIYILWRLCITFFANRKYHVDQTLSTIFYYKKLGIVNDKGEIILLYEENLTITSEDIMEAREYIINNCIGKTYESSFYKIIDSFEDFYKKN